MFNSNLCILNFGLFCEPLEGKLVLKRMCHVTVMCIIQKLWKHKAYFVFMYLSKDCERVLGNFVGVLISSSANRSTV